MDSNERPWPAEAVQQIHWHGEKGRSSVSGVERCAKDVFVVLLSCRGGTAVDRQETVRFGLSGMQCVAVVVSESWAGLGQDGMPTTSVGERR